MVGRTKPEMRVGRNRDYAGIEFFRHSFVWNEVSPVFMGNGHL